jgi:GntR family transcriptional regulator
VPSCQVGGADSLGTVIDPHAADWPRQQAARLIRERIESGEWGPRLPAQMKMAEEIGVAPKTIEKALDILKAEGLVYAVPGRGTFVRSLGDPQECAETVPVQ